MTLPPLGKGNVSSRAREARYAALEAWRVQRGLDWLVTAHHADDQLETLIMRLNRASGVAGMSGIRRKQGMIIRPLLHWRRAMLAEIVMRAGITPVDDPTNRDERYDRARLRQSLATADWLDPVAAARTADALADAEAAIDWAVRQVIDATVTVAQHAGRDEITFDMSARALPVEIVRRVVLACVRRIDSRCAPRGVVIDALLDRLAAGGTATIGAVSCRGGAQWRFSAAPPRRRAGNVGNPGSVGNSGSDGNPSRDGNQ